MSNKQDSIAWQRMIKEVSEQIASLPNNLQNVHTPFDLVKDILDKLRESVDFADKTFLVFNLEFIESLVYDYGVPLEKIWFMTDCREKAAICRSSRYNGVNVEIVDFLKWEVNMKFDVCVMNPPYQSKSSSSDTKTQAIWDKFVRKAISICKEDGYLAAIHPSGWRSCGTFFEDAKILKEKQIEYLEIHSEQDGLKTFGATTRYDWYILKNCKTYRETAIVDQNGVSSKVNLVDATFIPNILIAKVFSCLAKNDEEKIEVICNSSYHHQRKGRMSKTKKSPFIYPVVYSTPVEKPTIWYTNTKSYGHFGISKLILNPSRPIGFVIDDTGEYGMSEFCAGIVGDKRYLTMVANVIKNQKTNGFADFMEACHFTDRIFNKDIFPMFRKNIWSLFSNK